MVVSFYDELIPHDHRFVNAPSCRTRREATQHYIQSTHRSEPQPSSDGVVHVLHQIEAPFSMGLLIDRQVGLQNDGLVRKSIRIGQSNLSAEKQSLQNIKGRTSIPVPCVRDYYKSAEFEHLVLHRIPGVTLETAWPGLSRDERESVADEVVSFLKQVRELRSSYIEASLIRRKPLRPGLRNAVDFNMERIKQHETNAPIASYVLERSRVLENQANVFTHGDLDWGNIMISDGHVCGIIDLESSGFFPPYWEWVMVKQLSQGLPDDSWYCFLERRLRGEGCLAWDGMWQVEQLISALDEFSGWALTPARRRMHRENGWARVRSIVGANVGDAPRVTYEMEHKHPWWLELIRPTERTLEGKDSKQVNEVDSW